MNPTETRRNDEFPYEREKTTEADEKPFDEYTVGCCQKKRGFKFSITILSIMFIYKGMIIGIVDFLRLLLQEKGATMQQLSVTTIAFYPNSMKIFVAIFFDSFFMKFLGKCKTYILICGLIKIVLTFKLAFEIDD